MINIMPIFINFLAVDSLKLDNDKLEKFCLQKKKSSPGRKVSNGGGWQSDNLDLATPELAELFAEVGKRLDEVHRAFDFSGERRDMSLMRGVSSMISKAGTRLPSTDGISRWEIIARRLRDNCK